MIHLIITRTLESNEGRKRGDELMGGGREIVWVNRGEWGTEGGRGNRWIEERGKERREEWGKNKIIGKRVRVKDTEWEIELFGERERERQKKKKQRLYRERRDHERTGTNTD